MDAFLKAGLIDEDELVRQVCAAPRGCAHELSSRVCVSTSLLLSGWPGARVRRESSGMAMARWT